MAANSRSSAAKSLTLVHWKTLTSLTFQRAGLGIPWCWCCEEREAQSAVNTWAIPSKLLKALMSVEVNQSLPLDSCPVCSIPLDLLRVLKLARDLQMHTFTGGITDECHKSIKVQAGLICLDSSNNLNNRLKGRINAVLHVDCVCFGHFLFFTAFFH